LLKKIKCYLCSESAVRLPGTTISRRRFSWALAPVHLAAVATGAKSFRDNPIIGSPWLNRAGLHVARMRVAHRMVQARRRRLTSLISEGDRTAFERDGFVIKHDFLSPDAYDALKRQALSYAGPAREQIEGDAVTRRIAMDRAALARLPAARDLVENQEWLGLLRYVGASALQPLVYIQTIFVRARAAPADPQTVLHSDTFHSSVKAWLFLTDVTEADGPFVYVPGSHRPTRRRLAWERAASVTAATSCDAPTAEGSLRISPAALRRLGFGEPRRLCVPENTLIVADTMGFHARGVASRPSLRTEIWAYGRRNPFLPWLGWDAAAMPLIRNNAAPLYWGALDLRETLHLGRNPWRKAGIVTPVAPLAASAANLLG
jgi:hypothetical protein